MSKPDAVLAARLWEAALVYLGRAESSVESVRRMLQRRVARWAARDGLPPDPAAAEAIETVITRLRRQGAVDDVRYATLKVGSASQAGRSGRAIQAYLMRKGVAGDIVADALAAGRAPDAQDVDPDFAAALRLGAKRRLGRFREPEQRAAYRQKDLATLGRAGFSWDIARRLVDSED